MERKSSDTAVQEQDKQTSLSPITRRRVLQGAAAAGALGMLSGMGSAQERPQRYIVGLDAQASDRVATAQTASVYRRLDFGEIGKAVVGRFSQQARAALTKRSDVRYVEPDGTVHALAETLPWGVDRVDADVVHDRGQTGEGAHIAIIDTGIDLQHPDLQANIGQSRSFVDYTNSPDDDDGHGTHCAGTADAIDNTEGVIGVSTNATLHAAKVLNGFGTGVWSDVAAAIKWTADNGYDVGSMSLGASSAPQTIADACQYAVDKGVLLVAAAGNDGGDVAAPAKLETVLAVSATNDNDELAFFSSRGPEIELAAPGVGILSTYPGNRYRTLSGTSMACPHVAGAGGQLMALGYTNDEARQRLRATAEDIGLPPEHQGDGLLDVAAAVPQPPDISVAPLSVTLGTVTVGESATAPVTVTNTGGVTLTVSATEIDGATASAFTVTTGSAPFSLGPDESQPVTLEFAPTSPGEKQATLTIESTDPDEPTVTVALSGTAEPVFPEPLVIEKRGITLFEIGPPQDLDGDGLYEDVTGNDRFTFGDVTALGTIVEFYRTEDLDLTDAQVAALDFTHDGQLTEADTRALARHRLSER